MNNLITRKHPQIKDMKSCSYAKSKVIGKSNSVHKSPHISVNLRKDVLYSARRTNQMEQKEGSVAKEKNKLEGNNYLKEKQHTDLLRKSLHQKDQIILSKSLRIKQLEIEMIALKAQVERYKMKNRHMTLALEANKKNTCEMAQALLYNYLYENRNEGENEHISHPNPDTMTYEELLELENKIGYVSKGLPQDKIDQIPLVKYERNMDLDNKCLICQYEFEEEDELRKINCNHAFHRECLDQWLKDAKICPNCKREIQLSVFPLNCI